MSEQFSISFAENRDSERGGSTVKFLLVLVGLFIIGFAAYNYLIVWYQTAHFRDAMNETITQAYAIPNAQINNPEYVRQKLRRIGDEDGVPAEAVIRIDRTTNGLQAQVVFTREIPILPFNLYKYKYEFNHTATPPSGFLSK
jgi:hypothetical protein